MSYVLYLIYKKNYAFLCPVIFISENILFFLKEIMRDAVAYLSLFGPNEYSVIDEIFLFNNCYK